MMNFLIRLLVAACLAGLALTAGAGGSLANMTGDRRALKTGDLLLVQVLENSSASTTADTTTSKSGGFNVGISFPNTTKSASADLGTDFSGKGKIQRSGKVIAQLSVLVTGQDETGMLSVSGRQLIEINGDKQEIELSGRVRPEDVNDDNTILSSRIADARIRYVGDGLLAEQSRPGLLTRIFSWLGLL